MDSTKKITKIQGLECELSPDPLLSFHALELELCACVRLYLNPIPIRIGLIHLIR